MDEKDIDLSVVEDTLVLKGEKKEEREEDGRDYYLRERFYGRFQRSFQLPKGINPKTISAKYEKGVLTIRLPRATGAKTKKRRIAISSE